MLPFGLDPNTLSMFANTSSKTALTEAIAQSRQRLEGLANTPLTNPVNVPDPSNPFFSMLLSGVASAVSGNPQYLGAANQRLAQEEEQRGAAQRLHDTTAIQEAFQRRDSLTALLQSDLMKKYEALTSMGAHEKALEILEKTHKLELDRQKQHEAFQARQGDLDRANRSAIAASENAARLRGIELSKSETGVPYLDAFAAYQQGLGKLYDSFADNIKNAKGSQKKKIEQEYFQSVADYKMNAARQPWPGEDGTSWMNRARMAGLPGEEILRLGKKHFPNEEWKPKPKETPGDTTKSSARIGSMTPLEGVRFALKAGQPVEPPLDPTQLMMMLYQALSAGSGSPH